MSEVERQIGFSAYLYTYILALFRRVKLPYVTSMTMNYLAYDQKDYAVIETFTRPDRFYYIITIYFIYFCFIDDLSLGPIIV